MAKVCKHCNSIVVKGRWETDLFKGLSSVKILNRKEVLENISLARKNVVIKTKDEKKTVQIAYSLCECCSRRKSGYFEGIFQLRNKKNPSYDDILDELLSKIEHRKGVFISKVVRLKDGIDLYLSSNHYLMAIGKSLHKEHGGDHVISRKLFSRDRNTGKNQYRVTVLVRLPDFSKGNVVLVKKKLIYVMNVSKDFISGIDLTENKRVKIKDQKPQKIFGKDDFHEVIVVRKKPVLEVLHPLTYQSTKVVNSMFVRNGKVQVLVFEGKLFLLPF